MTTVLVTGASGFVGDALCDSMRKGVFKVRGTVRRLDPAAKPHILEVGEINADTDWSGVLIGVDCIVHCAAATSIPNIGEKALAFVRTVNVDGTRRLAEQAAECGVRRLVFLSSVKVHGESTVAGASLSEASGISPESPYGVSKWEAEQALREVSAQTGLEIVIVRPPLVYGPGVGGNFARLLAMVKVGLPLPFGAVRNRRSLIALDNLVDFLTVCVERPSVAGETFLVSDGEDLSTPDLLKRLGVALGRAVPMLSVPVSLLRAVAVLTGKSVEMDRLVGSLQIDGRYAREMLGWEPPLTVDAGIRRAVAVQQALGS